jgi:predicted ABC-type ATPase
MSHERPTLIALAGPNGAGKSTAGPRLLRETLGVTVFVNADVIAQGLAAFEPERVAVAAGRLMLARLRELGRQRKTFAFETTLAGRAYARWLYDLLRKGYEFDLVFLYLPSPEFAIERVRSRVHTGGHAIPESTIRRRYHAGLRNFFALYRPLTTTWRTFDNSKSVPLRLLAAGRGVEVEEVHDEATWRRLETTYGSQRRGG